MEIKVSDVKFYPEGFRRKLDAEKYQAKGTCEISLALDHVAIDLKNITYRIHSNKKAGIKPKLLPSVVFRDATVWEKVEQTLKEKLVKELPVETKGKAGEVQWTFGVMIVF